MKLETKYNIGDVVWWKETDNTIQSGRINAIRVNVYENAENVGIQYGILHKSFDDTYYTWHWDFYPTKEELLNSL